MRPTPLARREFLAESGRAATAGWLALQLPWLASMAACAREDAVASAPFKTLSAAEGRAMRAFAAQILPSEPGSPGAEEAGAVYFADRALGTPRYTEMLAPVRAGLADLDARAKGKAKDFAALPSEEQIAVMKAVEKSDFFKAARTLVITGTFADPSYGGNVNGAGWHLIGMEHKESFQAPFGWYDSPAGLAASGVTVPGIVG